MKKALALSSMFASVVFPTLAIAAPKVGLVALLSLAFATLTAGLTAGTSTFLGGFISTIFYAFFTAGGITPTEVILAF